MPLDSSFSEPDFQLAHPSVASKLGTNYVPSSVEASMVKSTLVDVLRELSESEEELHKAQLKVKEVQRVRDVVAKRASDLAALVSPARRMPADVWALIFTSDRHISTSLEDRPLDPLTYGSVCKQWREIALATPAAWSCLTLALEGEPTKEVDLRLSEGAKLWLKRAGSTGTFISLFHKHFEEHPWPLGKRSRSRLPPRSPLAPYTPNLLWDVLLPNMNGCQQLYCRLNGRWLSPLTQRQSLELSSMRQMAILPELNWGHGLHEKNSVLSIDNAPLLERLAIHGMDLNLNWISTSLDASPTMDLTRLTHLILAPIRSRLPFSDPDTQYIPTTSLLCILSQAPELILLKLSLDLQPKNLQSGIASIRLRRLEVLALSAGFSEETTEFHDIVSRLDCPSLKQFSLQYLISHESLGHGAVVDFVSRSPLVSAFVLSNGERGLRTGRGPFLETVEILRQALALNSLTLLGQNLMSADLRTLLELRPALESLTLDRLFADPGVESHDAILRVLHAHVSPVVLPGLRHLKVHMSHYTDDCVIDVIESRMNNGNAAKLTSCTLVPFFQPSDHLLSKVRDWKACGVDVHLDTESAHVHPLFVFDQDLGRVQFGTRSIPWH